MPDLLLELFSEEIPARMQAQAAESLRKLVTDALVERGLLYEGAKAFVTPRRLALAVHACRAGRATRGRSARGRAWARRTGPFRASSRPPASPPSIRPASRANPKKGDFYVAIIERPGRATGM